MVMLATPPTIATPSPFKIDGSRRKPRRGPMVGRELLDAAAECVARGDGPRVMARKCRIGMRQARSLYDEITTQDFARVQSRYDRQGLAITRHRVVEALLMAIEDAQEQVELSREEEGGPGLDTRPHAITVAAVRQICRILGLNAATQVDLAPTTPPVADALQHRAFLDAQPEVREAILANMAEARRIMGQLHGPA